MKTLFRFLIPTLVIYLAYVVWLNYLPTAKEDLATVPGEAPILNSSPSGDESALHTEMQDMAGTATPSQVSSAVSNPIPSPPAATLTFTRAIYGAENTWRDVTSIIQQRLSDGERRLNVSNHNFGGDPIFGKTKTLRIYYSGPNGATSFTVKEGENIDILASLEPEATPTPQPPRLAPQGIFFLTQYTSVSMDVGITGIAAGTRVNLVGEEGETVRVRAGSTEFDVERKHLTNDLNIAEAAAARTAQARAAGAAFVSQQRAAAQELYEQRRTEEREAQQGRDAHREAAQAAQARTQARIAEIRQRIAEIRQRMVSAKFPVKGMRQDYINREQERIQALQDELRRLGVASAALE